MKRRDFLVSTSGILAASQASELRADEARIGVPLANDAAKGSAAGQNSLSAADSGAPRRQFNDAYAGEHLEHIAFPLGGMGAGMVCLEGTGALSHVSLRHRPDVDHEPAMFAAISVKS